MRAAFAEVLWRRPAEPAARVARPSASAGGGAARACSSPGRAFLGIRRPSLGGFPAAIYPGSVRARCVWTGVRKGSSNRNLVPLVSWLASPRQRRSIYLIDSVISAMSLNWFFGALYSVCNADLNR